MARLQMRWKNISGDCKENEMRYFAKNLRGVYEILETLPKPLAVYDFASLVVGHEVRVAQGKGVRFYNKYRDSAHVVALCWGGAGILYSNISDDQIELVDKEPCRLGNRKRQFWKKIRWLGDQGHRKRLAAIEGIMVRYDPHNVKDRAVRKRMGGFNFLAAHWKRIGKQLHRTQHVFSTGGPPLIRGSYIAIYDRNERHQPERNVHKWQIELFRCWAKEFGLRLVVISDFYPRQWKDTIRMPFVDRNLNRLCNVIRHSALYAAPSSGCGNAGMIFGCNFVALSKWSNRAADLPANACEGRGFQYFGFLDKPDGTVANKIREYLKGKKMPENAWECQQRLVPNARVVFDVGANIGRTVGRYLERFPQATVYAFEPAPANVKRFKERLPRLHGPERVRLFDYAVLDRDGKTMLYLYGSHDHHSILKNTPEYAAHEDKSDWVRKCIKVRTVALDAFCDREGIEQIDVLKLDAEGAEPLILKGARRLLEEKRIRLIYVEVFFSSFFDDQIYAWDLIPRFLEYGYKFHSLWCNRGGKIDGADAIFLRE